MYKHTGARNVTVRINNTQLTDNEIEVYYLRRLSKSEVTSWSTARETGFSLHWWIEGDTGDKLEMEVEPRYLEENKIFRDWIEIFRQLIEEENIEQNTIIKTVKFSITLRHSESGKSATLPTIHVHQHEMNV